MEEIDEKSTIELNLLLFYSETLKSTAFAVLYLILP